MERLDGDGCPFCRTKPFLSMPLNRLLDNIGVKDASVRSLAHRVPSSGGSKVKKDHCKEHPEQLLSIWCEQCQEATCHECLIFDKKHDHGTQDCFKRLQDIYDSKLRHIKDSSESVKDRILHLSEKASGIHHSIQLLLARHDKHLTQVRKAYDHVHRLVEKKSLHHIDTLKTHRDAIHEERHLLATMLDQLNVQIQRSSQLTLINRGDEIRKTLDELFQAKEEDDHSCSDLLEHVMHDTYCVNAFGALPDYISGVLHISQFRRAIHEKQYVYSEPICRNGCMWRLKVYLNGTGVAKGEYLSVFLELSSTLLKEPSEYQYKIELVRHANPEAPPVEREFSSVFEQGESWGYNRFTLLEHVLKEENEFLGEDESLQFRFHVRPPSLLEQSKEQQVYIHHLESRVPPQEVVDQIADVSSATAAEELENVETQPTLADTSQSREQDADSAHDISNIATDDSLNLEESQPNFEEHQSTVDLIQEDSNLDTAPQVHPESPSEADANSIDGNSPHTHHNNTETKDDTLEEPDCSPILFDGSQNSSSSPPNGQHVLTDFTEDKVDKLLESNPAEDSKHETLVVAEDASIEGHATQSIPSQS